METKIIIIKIKTETEIGIPISQYVKEMREALKKDIEHTKKEQEKNENNCKPR